MANWIKLRLSRVPSEAIVKITKSLRDKPKFDTYDKALKHVDMANPGDCAYANIPISCPHNGTVYVDVRDCDLQLTEAAPAFLDEEHYYRTMLKKYPNLRWIVEKGGGSILLPLPDDPVDEVQFEQVLVTLDDLDNKAANYSEFRKRMMHHPAEITETVGEPRLLFKRAPSKRKKLKGKIASLVRKMTQRGEDSDTTSYTLQDMLKKSAYDQILVRANWDPAWPQNFRRACRGVYKHSRSFVFCGSNVLVTQIPRGS